MDSNTTWSTHVDSDGAVLHVETKTSAYGVLERYLDENYEYHRLDGPAVQKWDPNGRLRFQNFLRHGWYHRVNGPANEVWDANGNSETCEFWVEGKEVTPTKMLTEALNITTYPERLTELVLCQRKAIALFARWNLNCPDEAKVLWALTYAVGSRNTVNADK